MGFTFIVALLALVASITCAVFYLLAHNKNGNQNGATWKKDEKWVLKNPGAIANMVCMALTLLLVLITMMSGGGDKDGGDVAGGDGT